MYSEKVCENLRQNMTFYTFFKPLDIGIQNMQKLFAKSAMA